MKNILYIYQNSYNLCASNLNGIFYDFVQNYKIYRRKLKLNYYVYYSYYFMEFACQKTTHFEMQIRKI